MSPNSFSSSSRSDEQSDSIQDSYEPVVPELDNDVSTEDFTSDYLSTRATSILGLEHRLVDPDDVAAALSFDAASVYSPTHYPAVSITPYHNERLWDEVDTINSTRSITELDLEYVWENGRRYCGSYYMPNDDDEQVRLQLFNQVFLKVFEGELTTVPLECPTHILDIGTGVGDWAIDMAERYPECEITGTDIANLFERRVPQNVFWEVDNAELDWERPPDFYDLVHIRYMAGAFKDWDSIYKSAYQCLKPGGWVEILDFDDDVAVEYFLKLNEHDPALRALRSGLVEAGTLSGRPLGVWHLEPRLLVNAGYVDVRLTEHSIPLKTKDGSTGKFWLLGVLNGIEALCMRLLVNFKGYTAEEVRTACEHFGTELMAMALNPRTAKNFIIKARVLIGKKPGHLARWSTAPISESGEVMKRPPPEEMIPEVDQTHRGGSRADYHPFTRAQMESDMDEGFSNDGDESDPKPGSSNKLSNVRIRKCSPMPTSREAIPRDQTASTTTATECPEETYADEKTASGDADIEHSEESDHTGLDHSDTTKPIPETVETKPTRRSNRHNRTMSQLTRNGSKGGPSRKRSRTTTL